MTSLANYPKKPTRQELKANDVERSMNVKTILNDVVQPFPEYQKAALALATIIRSAYVARNPLATTSVQMRHALVSDGLSVPFPPDWKSSASGHLIISVTGMGKTTFIKAFLLQYPRVIRHEIYNGKMLSCCQVVYVYLTVPHDATLKSLCLQFFYEIDLLLGTAYSKQAKGVRQIAPMVQLMREVASATSLGFIVVDEVQNLKSARGGNAEFVLNLFSEIIERMGISLCLVATPAIGAILDESVRNSRKMTSSGETVFSPMKLGSPDWDVFCETYWDYQYVRNKKALSKDLKKAWHKHSAGNTAFAAHLFKLAQAEAIGTTEEIDAPLFEQVFSQEMSFLQPAIAALTSGRLEDLRKFEDLMFAPRYHNLCERLGAKPVGGPLPMSSAADSDEFEDIQDSNEEVKERKKSKKSASEPLSTSFEFEDPLKA